MSIQALFSKAYLGLRAQGFVKSQIDGQPVVCSSSKPLVRCSIGHMYDLRTKASRFREIEGIPNDLFHSHMVAAHDLAISPENMRLRLEHVADLFSLEVPND